MLENVKYLLKDVSAFSPKSKKDLEVFRLKNLGKKGELNSLFTSFKEIPNTEKKEFGRAINTLKQKVQDKINQFKDSFEITDAIEEVDYTRPVGLNKLGSRSPISLTRNKIVNIFNKMITGWKACTNQNKFFILNFYCVHITFVNSRKIRL